MLTIKGNKHFGDINIQATELRLLLKPSIIHANLMDLTKYSAGVIRLWLEEIVCGIIYSRGILFFKFTKK